MANSDKNILITPNRGANNDPKIDFIGASASVGPQTITMNVYPDSNGTLSWEGSAGQLFSITNDLTGTIFSVNDVSGIPSLEINADGEVKIAEFSGNVGIGLSTPTEKLDVSGNVKATTFIGALTNATGLPISTGVAGLGTGVATFLATPSSANLLAAVTNETGTGALVFATSPTLVTPALGTPASGVVTNLTGTASININGTVGATTPAAGAFTSLSATSPATFQAGTAALPAITTSGDTNTGIFFPAADTIAASTAGSERLRITSTGDVGIGTSAPSTNLQIGSGSSNGLGIFLSRGATTNFYEAYDGTKTFIAGTDAANAFVKVGSLSSHPVRLVAANGASNAYAELDTSGNLGLGVTPSAHRVADTVFQVGPVASLNSDTDLTTDVGYNYFYNSSNLPIYSTTAQASRYSQYQGAHRFFSAPSGTAGDSLTFTQTMTLDASARLGIGITSPAARLHIQGTSTAGAVTNISSFNGLRIDGSLSSAGVTGITYQDGGGGGAGIGLARGGAFETEILFYTNPAGTTTAGAMTERMRINNAGNVGIGTTAPDASMGPGLHIATTSGNSLILQKSTGAAIQFRSDAATIRATITGLNAVDGLGFHTGAAQTERMRITSAGNVGIGTTTPDANLTVSGVASFAAGTALLPSIARSGDLNTGMWFPAADTIAFSEGGAESMRINSTGNVGIGTTSPDANLTVNGAASFAAGTALLPSIARSGDLNTGFWFPAADTIAASTAGSERIRINSTGISVTGDINSTSDIRLKKDIKQISNALEKVLKLRGVSYTLKESGSHKIGVIAQEVEEVIPEVIGIMNDADNTKTVNYGNLVGLLIEAIKELSSQIEELKNK